MNVAIGSKNGSWSAFWFTVCVLTGAACSDVGEGAGGNGGVPLGGAGGAGGSAGGAGGAGGSGGSSGGGAGGAGGAGGSTGAPCLAPSTYESLFAILPADLCAVAVYDAPGLTLDYSVSPTWGRHGGPLTLSATGADVTLSRWAVPNGAEGALSPSEQMVPSAVDANGFVAAQAVDLPFFDWTAVGWAGAFPATQGELVFVSGGAVAEKRVVNSLFALAARSGASVDTGRVLYTGFSALDDGAGATNGLYAADACTDNDGPTVACAGGVAVATWGDASGPVAVGAFGTTFAVQTSFANGDQELRGFVSGQVAPGSGPSAGASLATLPGFGTQLAAFGETPRQGLVAFQPIDGATFLALDPVLFRYVEGESFTASEPEPLLDLATEGTEVKLFADDGGRLWVGVPTAAGATFVVLAPAGA
jgi:hypothetical protein